MVNIISGCSGQSGSYLAEILLNKGEKVVGFSRRTAVHSTSRVDHLMNNPNFTYLEGDITDKHFIWKLISDYKPDKFFNLAAQSHVHTSFSNPGSTFEIDTLGVLNILECIRAINPTTRFYQASTSEMFGKSMGTLYSSPTEEDPKRHMYYQDENTPFVPASPYAIAKLASHHLVRLYRESYNLWACSGILFNHESPRRGDNFVTQKIIKWIVQFKNWRDKNQDLDKVDRLAFDENIILAGLDRSVEFPKLRLGNLSSYRDWSHAYDAMSAVDLIMSQEKPEDYVVGSGSTHNIKEFLDLAFSFIGIQDWSSYVVIDPKFIRPSEVPYLCARPEGIKALGWKPKYNFKSLVKEMYEERLQRSSV